MRSALWKPLQNLWYCPKLPLCSWKPGVSIAHVVFGSLVTVARYCSMKFSMPSAVTSGEVVGVGGLDDAGAELLGFVGVPASEPGSSPEPTIQAMTTTATPTRARRTRGSAALRCRRGGVGAGTGATGAVITRVAPWSTLVAAGTPTGTARGSGAGSGADGPPARN